MAGLVAAVLSLSSSALAANSLTVKTKTGKVMGKQDGTVRAFLGIPYAQPPVGPLRWKPPMPAAKWKGVRQATEFGSHCMQPTIYKDMIFRDPGISEDCLNLNVWTTAPNAKAKLPVMVWIYGGGFTAGGTSEPRQDGTNLSKNGVVVVSMNYRLGIFGFFAHPDLTAESPHKASGNYGLMDQTAALQWVHDNIAAFGGDPAKVTVFGESAGSFSVSSQMASPLAKGLFIHAIGESGGAFARKGLTYKALSEAETQGADFGKTVLSATTIEQLRAIPAQQLMEAKAPPGVRFGPDVDGYFLPQSVSDIFAAKKQNNVPLLAGWNRDEGGLNQKATLETLKADGVKQFPTATRGFSEGLSGKYGCRGSAGFGGLRRRLVYCVWYVEVAGGGGYRWHAAGLSLSFRVGDSGRPISSRRHCGLPLVGDSLCLRRA